MSVYGNSRPQFTDLNGDPVQGGKLYIGLPDQDPKASPHPDVTDLDGNPISATLVLGDEGVTTVALEVDGDFSQAVFDSNDVEITAYQIARTGGFLKESDLVGVSGQGGDWNSGVTYGKDDFAKDSDGNYDKSLTNNNLGNDPTSTATAWSRFAWPTLYNPNETYDTNDSAMGSNGVVYLSAVDGTVGIDPTTDTTGKWSGGGIIGTVITKVTGTVPGGHLECDGSAISRTTYAGLFADIGTLYGVGDGSTTFEIPDLRGEFIRGWDNGKGTDPARAIASNQADAFESHGHLWGTNTAVTVTAGAGGPGIGNGDTWNTSATGGTETRPVNVAMMFCIKY